MKTSASRTMVAALVVLMASALACGWKHYTIEGPAKFEFPTARATFDIPAGWNVKHSDAGDGKMTQFTFNDQSEAGGSLTVTTRKRHGTPQEVIEADLSATKTRRPGRKVNVFKQESIELGGRQGFMVAYAIMGEESSLGPQLIACVELDKERLLSFSGLTLAKSDAERTEARLEGMYAVMKTVEFSDN